MHIRRVTAVAIAAATLAACGGGTKDNQGGGLTITASVPSVKANGSNQVTFTVTGSQKGPIGITTTKGTFLSSGSTTASFPATPFTAALVTCDSRVDATCQGAVQVTATDANLSTGRTSVIFAAVEKCADGLDNDADGAVDCADSECPAGTACSGTGKVCGGGTCSVCTGNGGAAEASETSCADGFDNDCDGLADCADSNCLGQICPTGQSVGGNPVFGTCKTGGTCTCVSTAETGTKCGNGLDDDCDGLIDCADPDCQPVGNTPGQFCNAAIVGLTCSSPAATGGVSTCSVCAPNRNILLAQPVETRCGDGIDNDCNGQTDCKDTNCSDQGLSCGANGLHCTGAGDMECRCPDQSGLEVACNDGLDNDCDGKVDCADTDCAGLSCGPNGRTCSGTTCACPGGQASESSCADGLDNDCDGLVDCADLNCRPALAGGFGQACQSDPSRFGEKCDFLGQCVCPGGQVAETTCNDGLDNDCDGLADCQDPDCVGKTCGTNGRTCAGTSPSTCSCPSGTSETGTQCADGVDNNCDGQVDCNDPGCQGSPNGAQCGPNPAQLCTLVSTTWICKDITTNYVLSVSAAATRLAANGAATTTVTATLKDGTTLAAIANADIAFSTTLGTVSTALPTNASGQTTATFTAPTGSGVAVVTADYTTATLQHVTATTSITLPQLAQVNLVTQQYPVMGALGSGFQEANELTFQLIDSNNQTYPSGLTVTFDHARLGGSYIGASPAGCTATDCSTTGVTDAAGKVKVILHSGTIANVVSVIARAQAGGSALLSATAGNIAIVGAKASGGEITISCSPRNIPAFIDDDCTNSNYGGADAKISCVVSLADRFKNTLGVATVVTYETEAGAAGPPASTPAYDTTKLPTQQSNLGKATNFVNATGFKLPADVAPFADEYSLAHGWDGCPTRTHNPRDGLVTIIAVVRGEEGFVDGSNGFPRDGVYQVGESFIDMPEPFVDYNDNGIRDGNEPYTDFNGNGAWDQPNGVWDADAAIWAETRVLYTDYVAGAVGTGPTAGMDLGSRFYIPPFPQTTPFATPPTPSVAAQFSVTAQQAGPPIVPPTSDTIPAYWADLNFNMPNYKYTYGVSKSAGAKITVAIPTGGSPTTLDGLGMGFTQQYCTTRTPSDPSTQCGSACDSAPCYLVTDVGNFSYGTYGALTVTGGTQPDVGVVCGYMTGTLKTTNTVTNQTTEVSRTMAVCGTSP